MSVQRIPGSFQRPQARQCGMNQMPKDPEALLDIVARLDELIEELKGSRQDFCAQLVGMARLELMMTVYRISEHEVGALRSLIDSEPQASC